MPTSPGPDGPAAVATPEARRALTPYLHLFRALTSHRIGAREFGQRFLQAYLSDDTLWSPALFDILDRVFADVDEYADDDRRRPAGGLDAAELRVRVARALDGLDSLRAG